MSIPDWSSDFNEKLESCPVLYSSVNLVSTPFGSSPYGSSPSSACRLWATSHVMPGFLRHLLLVIVEFKLFSS